MYVINIFSYRWLRSQMPRTAVRLQTPGVASSTAYRPRLAAAFCCLRRQWWSALVNTDSRSARRLANLLGRNECEVAFFLKAVVCTSRPRVLALTGATSYIMAIYTACTRHVHITGKETLQVLKRTRSRDCETA